MCGIVGVLDMEGRPVTPEIVWRMADMQRHRGPDDQGVRQFSLAGRRSAAHVRGSPPEEGAVFEGCVGFNRLSILDLSSHGHQPMCSADGKVFIACNGEIYNAFDYVRELEQSGYQFRSQSDTEVLLNLYHRDGIEPTLQRLNGMFAFCIVDLRSAEMHVVRDRMGIKPLYWTQQAGVFMCSSEIKSFLAHPAFTATIDQERIAECLLYRYIADEGTLLAQVRQLKPGHRLRITREGVETRCYWSIPDAGPRRDLSLAQAVEQLGHILEESVQRQLLSDVKVGCQLSGGIDSSLLSILASRKLGGRMDMVSIVLEDPKYSEDEWISQAASRAGAKSHRYLMTSDYALDHYDLVTWHLDEPMNPPGTVGNYLMASKARQFMTVLLSGEGADELFGGYERFCLARARPGVLPWLGLLGRMPGKIRRRARELGDWSMRDPVEWYLHRTMFMPPELLALVCTVDGYASAVARRRAIFAEGRGDHISNCCKYEMQTYLVSHLIRQDKMMMAHSVEDRVPYLDNAVVDFVRSLPSEYLVGGAWGNARGRSRNTKRVLKALARRHFGEAFVYRRKVGFGVPLRPMFQSRRFREMMEERLLPGMKTRGILRIEVVREWWRQACENTAMEDPLWNCLAMEIWAESFIDGRRPGNTGRTTDDGPLASLAQTG